MILPRLVQILIGFTVFFFSLPQLSDIENFYSITIVMDFVLLFVCSCIVICCSSHYSLQLEVQILYLYMCVLSRQSELSALKKKSLAQRTLMELVQLMSPAVESEGDSEGRQSGSLEWRLARSETTVTTRSYVWTPTSQEVSIFSFNLLMYLQISMRFFLDCSILLLQEIYFHLA